MTKQSVREKAREAQRAEFERNKGILPEGLGDLALGIYDQIDLLDAEKRSLLIQSIFNKVSGVAHDLDDLTERAVMSTLAGIGAYTNEVGREIACMTSTGDAAVDSIVEDVGQMLTMQFKALLGSHAETVEAAAERVKQRVAAGEDFEVVAREEEAAMRAAIAERAGSEPVPVAKEDTSTGLYL